MKRKVIASFVVFVSIMVFANTAVKAFVGSTNEDENEQNVSPILPSESANAVGSSLPKSIRIESVFIEANVQYVGIAKSGRMAVPQGYSDVGWYKYGVIPGQIGSAVMDGHVNNGFGISGVFYNLKYVKPGDEIIYTAQDGKRLTFVIEDVKSYDYREVPLEIIFNRNDKPRLNLITCNGEWDELSNSYQQRLVVYSYLKKD